MIDKSNVIYKYDGSLEGFLCCVFESYEKREIPMDIISPLFIQITFFKVKEIRTDLKKAKRVLKSIPKKIGIPAMNLVKYAFLTCLPEKELHILLFLRMGYSAGPCIMSKLGDPVVNVLFKAVKHLTNESHLIEGFLRFSVFEEGLAAQIGPKNYVLPLIKKHFCERYPEENFLIHDRVHNMALIHYEHKVSIVAASDLVMPAPNEDELHFRKLWKVFYNTIEVEGRYNPKCRNSHMPKRYWRYMTEFQDIRHIQINN